MVPKVLMAAAAALLVFASSASANSWRSPGETSRSDRQLDDWEVFGFDLSSIPDDPASLAVFKASLPYPTRVAIANRCRYDITMRPFRYSPKVREFCWAR